MDLRQLFGRNLLLWSLVAVALVATFLFVTDFASGIERGDRGARMRGFPPQEQQIAFNQTMRKLWEDHITWTRLVIVEFLSDHPGTNQSIQRLLENQEDIGNAVKPFYGDAAGNQLTDLLKEH